MIMEMLKDEIMINGVKYDNASPDLKVGFLEEGHKYVYVDDPSIPFTSVTSLIKQFHDEFIPAERAQMVVKNKANKTYYGRDWKEVMEEWIRAGKEASDIGTKLHAYGESLLIAYSKASSDKELKELVHTIPVPDSPKAVHVPKIVKKLLKVDGYELAKTEILLYDLTNRITGQSDILLKKGFTNKEAPASKNLIERGFEPQVEYNFMIYDWKFLKEKIKKKGFYNVGMKKYRKMMGPFKYLDDCNWIHYSIQLAIYQTLSGIPELIKEKVLVVVNDDGYNLVPAYPMHIYWDLDGKIQAVYELWNGYWYVSEVDRLYRERPEWLPLIF
jgi:hypothetical protein